MHMTCGHLWCQSVSWAAKRKVVAASSYAFQQKEKESQAQRAVVQHCDRQVRSWKINDCFTLLKRITRLKIVNSDIRSRIPHSYLERYSPKGSCHRDESSMNHTLAQNNLCEFWCGMHLTRKNTPIIPDRNGPVRTPEKESWSNHRQC